MIKMFMSMLQTAPLTQEPPRLTNQLWKKIVRFVLVGVSNTFVDIATFNLALILWPTTSRLVLLVYNTVAILAGALNSFFWNKYWTFRKTHEVTSKEIVQFALLAGMTLLLNNMFMAILTQLFPRYALSAGLPATLIKCTATGGTMFLSFVGMNFVVFKEQYHQERLIQRTVVMPVSPYLYSLSVIFPAYNEAENIRTTIYSALRALPSLVWDFEIIVVDDGSKDGTGAVAEAIASSTPYVRVLHHPINKGYGAALATGFGAATKEFCFYMDSDGQFDIRDLGRLLPMLHEYDGVFGYRIHRRDPLLRKLNSWGWNLLVRFIFNLKIRDIDGAFKIFRTDYFRQVQLEARGALMPTELVYKFARAGYTYTEIAVNHYPRVKGHPTGANLKVIWRAFRELSYYTRKWSTEEL
jgi:putative flippase GtrA/GT2 family glycosyltransferase